MWDLPQQRLEPTSPALEARVLTTGPGKSQAQLFTASTSVSKEPISCIHTVEDFQNYEGRYLTLKNVHHHVKIGWEARGTWMIHVCQKERAPQLSKC